MQLQILTQRQMYLILGLLIHPLQILRQRKPLLLPSKRMQVEIRLWLKNQSQRQLLLS
jgi:NhaP-type Na+/H+ and K+/H+ antiporter